MRPLQVFLYCVTLFTFSTLATPVSNDVTPVDSTFQTQVIQVHNTARADYGAQPVTWSDNLYAGAKQWADQCQFQVSDGAGEYGENIAGGSGNFSISSAMKLWMSQASKYDYNHPGFSPDTGSFTQVVWKSTTQVACAISDCPAGTVLTSSAAKFVVCRYAPAGNFEGRFRKNVGKHV